MQIKNENWMEFNRKHGPFALQLYLYFAKNKDGYEFALSQKAAEEAGIKKTSYHKYLNYLIDEGYLVWRRGNTYDFYETPHKPKKKPVQSSPSGELDSLQDEQESPPNDFRSSPNGQNFPQLNREIDNIDITDIINIGEHTQQKVQTGEKTGWVINDFKF